MDASGWILENTARCVGTCIVMLPSCLSFSFFAATFFVSFRIVRSSVFVSVVIEMSFLVIEEVPAPGVVFSDEREFSCFM